MLRLFVESQVRILSLAFRLLVPRKAGSRASLKRLTVLLAFMPLFAVVQLLHWAGFLLDEILFPAYRRVEVRAPLFVLGVPRSGTTHLHRVLAEDEQYTTFSTWECFFALSVTARRFWLGVGWLDAKVGRPLGRLLNWSEGKLLGGMAEVHRMSLGDPEEDYFALMPALACFILVLPFAHSDFVWHMGTFDRDMPEGERQRLMHFYHRALQRHLYVHGPDKRLLSKNAAFAPLAHALRDRFPDARFMICLREPTRTIPSQLSSIESGIRFFDALSQAPDLRSRLTEQLGFYYRNLDQAFSTTPENRCVWVTMSTLKKDLGAAIGRIYNQLELDLSTEFRSRLAHQEAHSRQYRSGHRYSLEQYGLTQEAIERRLGGLYAKLSKRAIALESAPEAKARRAQLEALVT
ncbi:sulfotransferase [Thiorhodococcus mannitoliphagus]|uniref:Sulfotransferase n=1 Tax=Thiorhodococcus mannitoliphagus TaxID=329406 RepID=A0A6P1E0J3_9GAMM|nr:sulfotransferase [Thiorhodococcus mannitoliphagus]NEX21524.1 sulfotransferase [Thiorhodococcus mannitoliphagus]